MSEIWKPIPGWEGLYEASDMGRVRSLDRTVAAKGDSQALRRGRILVPAAKGGRYLAVTLADGARRQQFLVHDLVLLTFEGPRPEGLQACHWDDDKANNVLSNLRYGTAQDNSDDKHRNGYSGKGERHPAAKLTEDEVRFIRSCSTLTNKQVAERYFVSPEHVWAIRARRVWKHI